MAQIDFYTGGNGVAAINSLGGSGLGFFGAGGFGASVAVGAYQDNTYITNSAGSVAGPQANNIKWIHSASGQVPTSVNLALTSIPNYQATLNIRFTHSSAVKTQNAQLRIYDRADIANAASGVTTSCAALIHPGTTQVTGGSGNSAWQFPAGTGYLNMSITSAGAGFSPGISGRAPQGAGTSDTQHDWYAALSASPNSIGSKTQYGLYFSTEYL